jgi:hypothetical protein
MCAFYKATEKMCAFYKATEKNLAPWQQLKKGILNVFFRNFGHEKFF